MQKITNLPSLRFLSPTIILYPSPCTLGISTPLWGGNRLRRREMNTSGLRPV